MGPTTPVFLKYFLLLFVFLNLGFIFLEQN